MVEGGLRIGDCGLRNGPRSMRAFSIRNPQSAIRNRELSCQNDPNPHITRMQPAELRKKLSGVIAFPVTPFKKDLSLDLDGLRGNLRSLLKHPICAVVAPAGTGQIHSLSTAEHLAVVKAT